MEGATGRRLRAGLSVDGDRVAGLLRPTSPVVENKTFGATAEDDEEVGDDELEAVALIGDVLAAWFPGWFPPLTGVVTPSSA